MNYLKILPVFILVICSLVFGQNNSPNLNVLPKDSSRTGPKEMMRKYLRELSYKAFEKRLEKYESLKSVDQINRYQEKMKQFFLQQLGLPHKKTPLNAKVHDYKQYNDYRLQKIIYESQPGFYVPVLLYLPQTKPPYPAVLVLCGHEETGKAAYQEICIDLARNGMAALCPEPIGQGERKQILNQNGKGVYKATTEHLIEGVAPILLGRSIATYMIWDGIRAIDYLISRPDIDSSRIGCTGNSGGGNRTSYLMALDNRVKCAAPSCFITTNRLKNEGKGPGDAEQNIHAQLSYGMDIPDYILIRAPKPTLILSATNDFVPIEGAWEAFREAKRIYTRLGYPEQIDLVETDNSHGFSRDLRVGTVRWMRRWLMGIDDKMTEKEMAIEEPEDLFCTNTGQVLQIPGSKSVFDLNMEAEKIIEPKRINFWINSTHTQKIEKIREFSGIRKLTQLPVAAVIEKEKIIRKSYSITKLLLQWDSTIQLPALLFQPREPTIQFYLYFHDQGKNIEATQGCEIEELVEQGNTILAVDLRGFGETQTTPWRYTDAHQFTGHDVAEYFVAYMFNKSFLGMRAEDILVCAKTMRNLFPEPNDPSINIISVGETGPAALHVFALENDIFKSLTLRKSLNSWKDVIKTPITKSVLNNVVHGGLQYYDLPDLVSLVDSRKIIIQDPVDAQGLVHQVK